MARASRYIKHDGSAECWWQSCNGREFESTEAMYAHVNSEHMDRFVCQWGSCTYDGARYRADFKRHMAMHTGEREFRCPVCDSAFHRGFNLKMHMRRHNQEKPFMCQYCPLRFAHKCALRTHTFHHTQEYPYRCAECPAAYTNSANLTFHVLRKHRGPWCVTCGQCYVPDPTKICGRCNMHNSFGVKERQFFDYVYKYAPQLAEYNFTLRDQPMGCGVRKRPDGLMQLRMKATEVVICSSVQATLHDDTYSVKLILEADENHHSNYDPSCELARLQDIRDRDNDALFVLRYNLDQPDAFTEGPLNAFCDRVLAVLNGEFVMALEAPTLFVIEYFGYPEKREQLLKNELERQCAVY